MLDLDPVDFLAESRERNKEPAAKLANDTVDEDTALLEKGAAVVERTTQVDV